jgi:hypothetical protein
MAQASLSSLPGATTGGQVGILWCWVINCSPGFIQ